MCKIVLCLYFFFGVLVTAYQTYRGFMLQWFLGIRIPPLRLAVWEPPPQLVGQVPPVLFIPNVPVQPESIPYKVILLCTADAFTYFVCASSGFISLFAFFGLASNGLQGLHDQSVLLAFLLLYGVSGITGKLPEFLGKLKLGG
jgi:hypothetical protein